VANVIVNGIRLYYEVHGEGTPLVLTHGFGATAAMWAEQIPVLSQKYKVIVYDFRGHGRTEVPRDWSSYSFDDYVEDLRQLLDHLGVDTAYVGGLSMGGSIAMRFALAHPERLKALLLCDTSARNWGLRRDGVPQSGLRGVMRRFLYLRLVRLVPLGFALARYLPLEYLPGNRGIKPYVRDLRRQTALGLRGAWHALMDDKDVEARLGEIQVPTLIIVGERDRLLAPSRIMQQRIAGCRFALIKDSGHGTNFARPDTFNKVVLDFLADVDAGRPVAGEIAL